VHQPARNARNQERVGNLELDGVVDRLLALLQHRVELFGLGDGTRETVEDEAGC
jgi:hypothetical protein